MSEVEVEAEAGKMRVVCTIDRWMVEEGKNTYIPAKYMKNLQ